MTLVSGGRPSRSGELDELTLARACRGDQDAGRAFFEHYQRAVFAYLWRMLSPRASRALVEDMTQETFLRAFAALSRFSPGGAARPSSWLLTIATRVALNEIRRHRRHPESSADWAAIAGGPRGDESAERRALGAVLAREIARLAPDFRAVFLLREYHDLSYDEIARALDIELGTVQSRLARARAALRKALEDLR
jgi:RNA polymerase sigma-70 factor, ECF subfamily